VNWINSVRASYICCFDLESNLNINVANEIGQLEAELNQHQRTVQEQNISADEVIRMNTEHASLSTNVQDLAQKVQEARTKLGKLEIAVAQRGGKAEDLIEAYNDKLISIQLSGHDGADLTLDLNTATDNVKEILRGPDLVKDVRPTMNEAMTERQKARSQVESEKLAVEAELEQYSVDCTNESDKHTALRRGTEQITNEANAIQEVWTCSDTANEPNLTYWIRIRRRSASSRIWRRNDWRRASLRLSTRQSSMAWVRRLVCRRLSLRQSRFYFTPTLGDTDGKVIAIRSKLRRLLDLRRTQSRRSRTIRRRSSDSVATLGPSSPTCKSTQRPIDTIRFTRRTLCLTHSDLIYHCACTTCIIIPYPSLHLLHTTHLHLLLHTLRCVLAHDCTWAGGGVSFEVLCRAFELVRRRAWRTGD
jgi:hypothetical protein